MARMGELAAAGLTILDGDSIKMSGGYLMAVVQPNLAQLITF
jgi:hypothetical protein